MENNKAVSTVSWIEKAKKKFNEGDKVTAAARFSDRNTDTLKGKIGGIYEHFLIVEFDAGFRQCYSWHKIYMGAVKGRR